ncbi:MAG TPA: chitobiase/beta-hexosaminidase C-terminal domain-containing protein [Spirochaetota bacterium]|nr:chitobiase/beta-hexosaminidase C-terminal domain-containing protein [Spirochaetota bacterium]
MKRNIIIILSFITLLGCDLFITLPEKKTSIPDKPVIEPISGKYDNTVDITISAANSNAYIYFTIDGTRPTNTNYYSAGKGVVLFRGKKLTIKAVVYKDGFVSDITETEYR